MASRHFKVMNVDRRIAGIRNTRWREELDPGDIDWLLDIAEAANKITPDSPHSDYVALRAAICDIDTWLDEYPRGDDG